MKKQKNLCTVFFRVKKVICHLLRDIITFCAIIFASVLNACICELWVGVAKTNTASKDVMYQVLGQVTIISKNFKAIKTSRQEYQIYYIWVQQWMHIYPTNQY